MLFGLPVFGSFFIPLAIAGFTLVFYWTCILPKKCVESTVLKDKPISIASKSVEQSTKVTSKKVKKKGCCGKKGTGACSSKNGTVDTTKVFLDEHSTLSKELGSILFGLLAVENLSYEIVNVNNGDVGELIQGEKEGSSLCVFIIEVGSASRVQNWLEMTASNGLNNETLKGLKYGVFAIEDEPIGKVVMSVKVDQRLHKLGAVRICKPGTTATETIGAKADFECWAVTLIDRLHKWNNPQSKACKCGPEDGKTKGSEEEGESCCGSSSDSESDADNDHRVVPAPIVDLEDLVRVLK